ncbi:MAG: PEP-CTERM sorting domain-containing protein [Bryobacterales bacterium]|nr:PEP-CTERM sorting domain-containing protein [Bryobacterales bacterium]
MKGDFLGISLFVVMSSVNLNAGVIFSDNFDATNGGAGQLDFAGFTNWTVSAGAVDLIGNGFNDIKPGNGLYVDLDGSTYISGGIQTVAHFNLTPGNMYTLSFSLANNSFGPAGTDQNAVEVLVGVGPFSETINLNGFSDFSSITRQFSVAVPTLAQLSFGTPGAGVGGDAYGVLLDNVVLSEEVVPEPSSFLLLLAGAPLMLSRVRRRLR